MQWHLMYVLVKVLLWLSLSFLMPSTSWFLYKPSHLVCFQGFTFFHSLDEILLTFVIQASLLSFSHLSFRAFVLRFSFCFSFSLTFSFVFFRRSFARLSLILLLYGICSPCMQSSVGFIGFLLLHCFNDLLCLSYSVSCLFACMLSLCTVDTCVLFGYFRVAFACIRLILWISYIDCTFCFSY
jgi:hypothetical protein